MQGWLVLGVAMTACSEEPSPIVCSSGVVAGTSENQDMTPGEACNACHAYTNAGGDGMEAPIFAFAGTVYETKHEPDDCVGGPVGSDEPAQVEVVDAIDRRFVAPVTAAGNFMLETTEITYPITARVMHRGRVRWMVEPQMSGDCNTCHSATGKEGASGRVRLP